MLITQCRNAIVILITIVVVICVIEIHRSEPWVKHKWFWIILEILWIINLLEIWIRSMI